MRHAHGSMKTGFGDRLATLGQSRRSLGNVPAATIVETDIEHQRRVVCGGILRLRQTGTHFVGQADALANEMQAHALFRQLWNLARQRHGH